MAKTPAPPVIASEARQSMPAAVVPDSSAPSAPLAPVRVPTPENTPVPGGGRWRWGFLPPGPHGLLPVPGWVEVPEPD